jgi:flagellar biosynthetic protein FliP
MVRMDGFAAVVSRCCRRWGWCRLRRLAPLLLGLLLLSGCALDQTGASSRLSLEVSGADQPAQVSTGIQLMLLLTVLSLAPAFFVLTTAFTRIIIVLAFVRNALGVPMMPPNQILTGLALLLTIFVMAPVWQEINTRALQPYLSRELTQEQALERGLEPIRNFMFRQTREKDIALFISLAKAPQPRTRDEVPLWVLVPAFVISELKTAFTMGFVIFVPFLIIDMVVSSVLMSMGMMMLPPVIISLPFKILLFVMVDGWHLITRSLVTSFG